jgi:transcriptional regulator with XRE-family HTH domain
MEEIRKGLADELKDPEARRDYADEFLSSYIALQIKTLRQQRGWSQAELAQRAGMKQSRISAMEQADYSGWSLRTLQRLAAAFDLAFVAGFESFGRMLDSMTSISRAGLERPSFDEDPAFREKPEAEGEVRKTRQPPASKKTAGEGAGGPRGNVSNSRL